jgi:hypothetical protein
MPADERREIEAAIDRLLNGTPLREQNQELRRKLDDMRAERDEYKQAADARARALNVLTAENDELRRRANRSRQFAGLRPLAQ